MIKESAEALSFAMYSDEEVFYKKQQDNSRYAEHACDYRAEPAHGDTQPDKSSEKVKNEKHHETQNCVEKQLQCPFNRSCKNFNNEPQQQTADNDIDREI